MITYDYRCEECNHRFEVVQSMHEDSLSCCPKCSKDTLSRVFHPPVLNFKGSGFYCTDNKKGKPATPGTESLDKVYKKGENI